MILGVGVDVVQLSRFSGVVRRRGADALARRILGRDELQQLAKLDGKLESVVSGSPGTAPVTRVERWLATRWAIKEAAFKAVFPRIRPRAREVAIRKVDGKPFATILQQGGAAAIRLHSSVSHDGDYILATVIAEGGAI